MVKPVIVTVTGALAASVEVPVVMTIDVAVDEAALPVAPPLMSTLLTQPPSACDADPADAKSCVVDTVTPLAVAA